MTKGRQYRPSKNLRLLYLGHITTSIATSTSTSTCPHIGGFPYYARLWSKCL